MILKLKKVALVVIGYLMVSCGAGNDQGELIGVKGGLWKQPKPYGMTLVPGGAFVMGSSDYDKAHTEDATTKTVTVSPFYMDDTEITNGEYRQFVNWVRDSIVRRKLAIMAEESGQSAGGEGIGKYAFLDTDQEKLSAYDKYMYENYGDKDNPEKRKINRKVKLIWDKQKWPDEHYVEVMDSMYVPIEETYNGRRPLAVEKLVFKYQWMDIEAAARSHKKGRKDFIKEEIVKIYPDTTVWIKDFNYSYNEPMHNDYFWHYAYSEYPVVGVTWRQAKAFCEWRTLYKHSFQKAKKNGENLSGEDFRGAIEFSDTHSYYIEAAKGAIRIPNDIEVNGNTVRFVGRLYSYNCLPNDGEFTDPFPPRGKVFRYYEYEVIRPFKIRAIYNPPTKNDSVIYLTFPKNIQ